MSLNNAAMNQYLKYSKFLKNYCAHYNDNTSLKESVN